MKFIHVDVDNIWMYEKEYGLNLNFSPEQIYTQALPNFLSILDKFKIKATFMIIGKDMEYKACRQFCQIAVENNHEIGNHTWSHPSLSHLSKVKKFQEINQAHQKIFQVCGKPPIGFRGPGYFLDRDITEILEELGYKYDSSILPGPTQLLMKLYAYSSMQTDKAFGKLEDLFSSTSPYTLNNHKLLEFPISILPILRFPIHTTFLYYLGSPYQKLIEFYLKSNSSYILYLFHAIDFLDIEKTPKSPIVPLRYSFTQRMELVERILNALSIASESPIETTYSLFQ